MKRDSFLVRPTCSGAVVAVDTYSTRSFARHSHDEFGVGLMTDGTQRSGSGRGPVEAFRGNVITVNPAELHAPVVDDQRLARLFLASHRAALHPRGKLAFEERLLALFDGLFGSGQRAECGSGGRLAQARERIDDAPAQSHSLTDLAALAGLSRYQTVRGFARLTGLTPHAYVMQRRLDQARSLIRQGSALADAATEAGFANQGHMHRIFVGRHGFTPGAYASAFRQSPAISSKIGGTRLR